MSGRQEGRRSASDATSDVVRRYREHEGDEAIEWLTAQQIIDRYRAYAGLPLEERDDDVRS